MRLQPCTEADFAKFYPPDVNIIDELANLKERGTLFCLDWQAADFTIYGTPNMDLSKRAILDLRALPCQALSDVEIEGDGHHSHVSCNEDKDAAIEYLE